MDCFVNTRLIVVEKKTKTKKQIWVVAWIQKSLVEKTLLHAKIAHSGESECDYQL